MKKQLITFLLACSCAINVGVLSSCKDETTSSPSTDSQSNQILNDEQQIENRIYEFLTAYNEGDADATLGCLAAKPRNTFKAALNLVGGIIGGKLGVDIDLADFFALGVGITPGDFMGLEITGVQILSSTTATATTKMNLVGLGGGMQNQTVYFEMVYEHGGWYINDMTDNASGNTDNTTDNSGNDSTAITTYYITTYSNTSQYGTAGSYTEYDHQNFEVGSTVTLEATVNDGFNFEGWYKNNVCLSTDLTYQYEMKAENSNIEARYSYYTLSVSAYNDNYGTAGTYTKYRDKKISIGETIVLEATVNKGYNFEGWYVAWTDVCLSKDLTYSFEMKAENLELQARYSYYTVTVQSDSDEYGVAGSFTEKNQEKISIGDSVTLTATVNKGYTFEGWFIPWTDTCLSKDLTYTFEMEAENIEIEARYSYYKILVCDVLGGIYGLYQEVGKVSAGDKAIVIAPTYAEYEFTGWYINNVCVSTESTYVFDMPNNDVYILAVYSSILE